jgi:NAD(P)-dependent dehydrogenase (short-subunit alcohol dehydrogenase family)
VRGRLSGIVGALAGAEGRATPDRDIAVVVGVGPVAGLGGALCRRFAAAGLHVLVSGRSPDKLREVVLTIEKEGGSAAAAPADATRPAEIEQLFAQADAADGRLAAVVYNAGNAAFGDPLQQPPEQFEAVWRLTCFGGFLVAQQAGRRMVPAGAGTLLFTGATASLKARPPFAAFASAKFALRGLAQALARDWGPKGVHVAHVVVDGAIGGEKIRRGLPQVAERLGDEGMIGLEGLAEAYFALHAQPRTAWTHEIDLRTFKETW